MEDMSIHVCFKGWSLSFCCHICYQKSWVELRWDEKTGSPTEGSALRNSGFLFSYCLFKKFCNLLSKNSLVSLAAMSVTVATRDSRVTTVSWTSPSVPPIPVSTVPHVQRESKDTPASAGQVPEVHAATQTLLCQHKDTQRPGTEPIGPLSI